MMAEYNQGWAARAAANPDDEIIKSGVKPVSCWHCENYGNLLLHFFTKIS